MKNKLKLIFIAVLTACLLLACSNQSAEENEKEENGTKKESNTTSVTIKNLSTANFQLAIGTNQEEMEDKKDLPIGSEIKFSAEDGDTLTEGLTYIYCQIFRSDEISMKSAPIICKVSEPLNIIKNENTLVQLTDNTVVIDLIDSNNKGTVSTILSSPVLTVKNSSSYDFSDVSFLSEQFFSDSLEKLLEKDAEDKQAIYDEATGAILNTESGYLYFTRESDKAVLRTKKSITVKRGKSYDLEIKDDTEVAEVNNEKNIGALSSIEKKVVFYDGAENEVAHYETRKNTFYQKIPPEELTEETKAHETYISMALNGILSFTVNMEKAGELSFWYASPQIEYFGIDAVLSVNGNEKKEFRGESFEWAKYTTNLESGENTIKIEIKDTVGSRWNNFYLDDLLVVYKE